MEPLRLIDDSILLLHKPGDGAGETCSEVRLYPGLRLLTLVVYDYDDSGDSAYSTAYSVTLEQLNWLRQFEGDGSSVPMDSDKRLDIVWLARLSDGTLLTEEEEETRWSAYEAQLKAAFADTRLSNNWKDYEHAVFLPTVAMPD